MGMRSEKSLLISVNTQAEEVASRTTDENKKTSIEHPLDFPIAFLQPLEYIIRLGRKKNGRGVEFSYVLNHFYIKDS